MKNYKFTKSWFTLDGLNTLNDVDREKELNILEIGCFEGKSTIWFLENILINENSKITCVDPWMNFSQNDDSINSYGKEKFEWNLEGDKIKDNFLHNIEESGLSHKVIINQGESKLVLANLITEDKKFDIIFIDGNHTAPYVMIDSVMSFQLLNKGGLMIFDDYLWGINKIKTLRPKESIDYFVEIFSDYCEVEYSNYRKIIRKIK